MTYQKTNDNFIIDVNGTISLLGLTQNDFLDDINSLSSKKRDAHGKLDLGWNDFRKKWKLLFDIRKKRSKKSYTKAGFLGTVRRLYNPNYYSNFSQIKDFESELEKAYLTKELHQIPFSFHKTHTFVKVSKVPANFKSKLIYGYSFKIQKIGKSGFRLNHPNINNWNDFESILNIERNILNNSLKRFQTKQKLLFGFKLWLELFDDKNQMYFLESKGIKTQIAFNVSVLIKDVKFKLKEMRTILINLVRSLRYHIYSSRISINEYYIK